MNNTKNGFEDNEMEDMNKTVNSEQQKVQEKGPFSYFTGALTSGLLSWLCFEISKKIVLYFLAHEVSYTSPLAQSVASGFKTLIIGISFLATFTFGFIGLGLTLVFFKSLIDGKKEVAN